MCLWFFKALKQNLSSTPGYFNVFYLLGNRILWAIDTWIWNSWMSVFIYLGILLCSSRLDQFPIIPLLQPRGWDNRQPQCPVFFSYVKGLHAYTRFWLVNSILLGDISIAMMYRSLYTIRIKKITRSRKA